MGDLSSNINEAIDVIESIVEDVGVGVDCNASDILDIQEDIEIQLGEYNRCADPDCRLEYHEDITGLIGRRTMHFDQIHEWLEDGRQALSKIEDAIFEAHEKLDELERSDCIPSDTEYTVPPADRTD